MSAETPIDPQHLETLERFLQQVEAPTLFDYLHLDPGAAPLDAEAALQKRRSWAQGQQANPKFRQEALWVIKNMPLLREILLENADAYRDHLRSQRDNTALETLDLYIRGALADKVLTARAEAAILRQGRELGLADRQIQRKVQDLLEELGARRTPKGLSSAPTIALDRGEMEAAHRSALEAAGLSSEDRPASDGHSDTPEPSPAHDAPPPPQQVRRSIQPGQPPASAQHAPQLELDGPEERTITVGREPATLDLVVRNTGIGRMSGQINTDRPWITASPEKLEPALTQQVIRLTIDPRKMSRRRAAARITIATRSAGSRSVLIHAQRRSSLPLLLLGLLVVAALAAALNATLSPAPAPVAPDSRLIISVDPPAGEIFVNDTLITTQGSANLTTGFPIGAPFPVRVDAGGFTSWSQSVTVPSGRTVVIKPELTLSDPMSYLPPSEAVQGVLGEQVVKKAIDDRHSYFDRCFVRHTPNQPVGSVLLLSVRGYVDPLGHVRGLQFPDRETENRELETCLRRQFRALSLPVLDVRVDYAVFEHIFRYTVTEKRP